MKLGILFSGRGTTLGALIDACADPDYPAEIVIAICNNPNAAGIAVAQEAGIPLQIINHKEFDSRDTFDAALDVTLKEAGVELVCNAGFMRILTDGFVASWHNRQLNIHPSLLPAFKGLHVHERVLQAGARISGASVHFVRAEMDEGPIVAQVAIPVEQDDTPESLAERVLVCEHQIYPMAVRLVAEGKARVQGERVIIEGGEGSGVTKPAPLFVPALGK